MFCTARKVLGPTEQPKSVTRNAEDEKLSVSRRSKTASLISSLAASMTFLCTKEKLWLKNS